MRELFEIFSGTVTKLKMLVHCTEVRFASFLSGGCITAIVVNSPESKLTKRTSVHCSKF